MTEQVLNIFSNDEVLSDFIQSSLPGFIIQRFPLTFFAERSVDYVFESSEIILVDCGDRHKAKSLIEDMILQGLATKSILLRPSKQLCDLAKSHRFKGIIASPLSQHDHFFIALHQVMQETRLSC